VFVAALLFLSPIRVLLCHRFADYSQCPHYNSPLVFVFSSVAVIFQTKRESGRRVSQRGGSPGLPTSTSALEKSLVLTHSSAAMKKPMTSTVVRPHWATATQPPSVRNFPLTMQKFTATDNPPPLSAWLTISTAIHRQCFRRAASEMCIGHPKENPTGQTKIPRHGTTNERQGKKGNSPKCSVTAQATTGRAHHTGRHAGRRTQSGARYTRPRKKKRCTHLTKMKKTVLVGGGGGEAAQP